MAVGNNEAKSVDQKEKARVTAEQVKAQKLSAERLSGLVTPRRTPKEIAKTADELTVAFVGGFVGRGDSSLRGILADDWEILAKALAESQAKKRRHASKSKPAVKVFKPPATAEEIRAQKSSVERLSEMIWKGSGAGGSYGEAQQIRSPGRSIMRTCIFCFHVDERHIALAAGFDGDAVATSRSEADACSEPARRT